MTSPAAGSPEKRPPGRSLFNRPRANAPPPARQNGDIFSRGAESYAARIAEREARRQKRGARESLRTTSEDEHDGHPEKRRRISDDDQSSSDESDDEKDGTKAKPRNSRRKPTEGAATKKQRASATEVSVSASPVPVPSPTLGHASEPPKPQIEHLDITDTPEVTAAASKPPEESQPSRAAVIELDDGHSDMRSETPAASDGETHLSTTNRATAPADEAVASQDEGTASSEDEFPELSHQARQLARQRKQGINRSTSPTPALHKAALESNLDELQTRASQTKPEAPVIKLLITSSIPNTRRLEVRRRLDQRLRDVRRAWCQHSGLSEQDMMDVILVWRDKRLFDSSSCQSLGLGVDAEGDTTLGRDPIDSEDNDRVRLEAMTIAMFEEMRREKQRRKMLEAGAEQSEFEGQPKLSSRPKDSEEPKVRLVLRAKNLPEVKVILPMVRLNFCSRSYMLIFACSTRKCIVLHERSMCRTSWRMTRR